MRRCPRQCCMRINCQSKNRVKSNFEMDLRFAALRIPFLRVLVIRIHWHTKRVPCAIQKYTIHMHCKYVWPVLWTLNKAVSSLSDTGWTFRLTAKRKYLSFCFVFFNWKCKRKSREIFINARMKDWYDIRKCTYSQIPAAVQFKCWRIETLVSYTFTKPSRTSYDAEFRKPN